jgi:hypothetical protein
MNNINIPLDAHIAATVALQKAWINCNSAEDAALAVIAAAIEAWPQRQKVHNREDGSLTVWTRDFIILPLEQKP